MTAPPMTAGPQAVDVVRPSARQQIAAGLAAAAALVAVGTLGASLSTISVTGEGDDAGSSLTRVAWGESLTGFSGGQFAYPSVPWGAPMVLVALLLTGAAVAGLLAARAIGVVRWAVVAQLLTVAGGALAAGVLIVLWRVAAADLETGETVEDTAMTMGPVPGLLCLLVVLACASAVTAARSKPVVIARVSVTS
jgi:hypothetical protein